MLCTLRMLGVLTMLTRLTVNNVCQQASRKTRSPRPNQRRGTARNASRAPQKIVGESVKKDAQNIIYDS